jgi:hypothetical protein
MVVSTSLLQDVLGWRLDWGFAFLANVVFGFRLQNLIGKAQNTLDLRIIFR